MSDHQRSRTLILGAVFFGYIALRLWGLTDSCLWFDEIFSVHAARHGWSDILWFIAQDLIHPPLFYLLLKAWISIGGEGLYWLRLFPVFFSVLALIPFYLLCRELKLKFTTILFALVFFSVNGALIKYAQEVRMYSVLLFLSLVSIWLFARFFFRGKNIWILTIVNALMIYTHYFGWFVVLAEVMTIFLFQRIKIRHVLIMLGIEAVAFVPWVWGLWKAAATGASVSQNIGWIERPGIRSILDFAFDLVEPFYFQQTSADPPSIVLVSVPLLIIVAAVKMWYLLEWKQHERNDGFFLLAVLFTLPILLAFGLSWIMPFSIWGARHLIVVFPLTIILASIYVMAVPNAAVRNTLVGLCILISVVALALRVDRSTSSYVWCALEGLGQRLDAGDGKIYATEDLIAYHLWHSIGERVQVVKLNEVPEAVEDKAYFIPRGFDGISTKSFDEIDEPLVRIAYRSIDTDKLIYLMETKGYALVETRSLKTTTGIASITTFERKK